MHLDFYFRQVYFGIEHDYMFLAKAESIRFQNLFEFSFKIDKSKLNLIAATLVTLADRAYDELFKSSTIGYSSKRSLSHRFTKAFNFSLSIDCDYSSGNYDLWLKVGERVTSQKFDNIDDAHYWILDQWMSACIVSHLSNEDIEYTVNSIQFANMEVEIISEGDEHLAHLMVDNNADSGPIMFMTLFSIFDDRDKLLEESLALLSYVHNPKGVCSRDFGTGRIRFGTVADDDETLLLCHTDTGSMADTDYGIPAKYGSEYAMAIGVGLCCRTWNFMKDMEDAVNDYRLNDIWF